MDALVAHGVCGYFWPILLQSEAPDILRGSANESYSDMNCSQLYRSYSPFLLLTSFIIRLKTSTRPTWLRSRWFNALLAFSNRPRSQIANGS